jgi:hypothetical protein
MVGWAMAASSGAAQADAFTAAYVAHWAGLPAARIRLQLDDAATGYRASLGIETEGISRWFTHFRADVTDAGALTPSGGAAPAAYDAVYDLRKRRANHISLRFVPAGEAVEAERGPGDTSHKPPLAAAFRRDVVDPLAALAFIRQRLRVHAAIPGETFVVPVYDGARRFDVTVTVVAVGGADRLLHLRLMLRPIAGFKGESSDDGDPDDAPRPVDLTMTDDARLTPMSLTASIFFLPLIIRFDHACTDFAACTAAPE